MPVQHAGAPEQAQENLSQEKIYVTSKSPVGDVSVVTLIRTNIAFDHSQKAAKMWRFIVPRLVMYINVRLPAVQLARALCRAASSVHVASLN